jgi:predicted transcriptional regulator
VPRGAVAIVAATPVTAASFAHWLAIVRRGNPGYDREQAVTHTVSFLVKAQWLQQEAVAEGIDESKLNQLISSRPPRAEAQIGMTVADATLQARLDLIAEALRRRHGGSGLALFVHAYQTQWRASTLCQPGYVVPECRNYAPP